MEDKSSRNARKAEMAPRVRALIDRARALPKTRGKLSPEKCAVFGEAYELLLAVAEEDVDFLIEIVDEVLPRRQNFQRQPYYRWIRLESGESIREYRDPLPWFAPAKALAQACFGPEKHEVSESTACLEVFLACDLPDREACIRMLRDEGRSRIANPNEWPAIRAKWAT